MSDTATTAGRTLAARFALRAEAETATARLREAGIADGDIRLTEEAPGSAPASVGAAGLVTTLRKLLTPKPERQGAATGQPRGRCLVRVADLADPERRRAAEILRSAGAVAVEEISDGTARTDPAAFAPRKVQSGFKDVAPGYVPEPSTEAGGSAPPDHAVDFKEPRGRFADELNELPEGGRQVSRATTIQNSAPHRTPAETAGAGSGATFQPGATADANAGAASTAAAGAREKL